MDPVNNVMKYFSVIIFNFQGMRPQWPANWYMATCKAIIFHLDFLSWKNQTRNSLTDARNWCFIPNFDILSNIYPFNIFSLISVHWTFSFIYLKANPEKIHSLNQDDSRQIKETRKSMAKYAAATVIGVSFVWYL